MCTVCTALSWIKKAEEERTVSHMDTSIHTSSEVEDQPAVNCSKHRIPAASGYSNSFHVLQHPLHLEACKVCAYRQACRPPKRVCSKLVGQLVA